MSTTVDTRPSCRIIAYNSKLAGILKTVNVTASQAADKTLHLKEFVQLTAVQAKAGVHPTFMASAVAKAAVPTIYISGYTAPN